MTETSCPACAAARSSGLGTCPECGERLTPTPSGGGKTRLASGSGIRTRTPLGPAGPAPDVARGPLTLDGIPGDTVLWNKFEVLGKLGQGGMGAVYRARDTELDVEVAVKLMTASLGDPVARERLRTEVIEARDLRHDNIVNVHSYHADDEHIGFSMEYIDGASLQDHIDGHVVGSPVAGPGSVERLPLVAELARQLCDALDYVHGRGLVHRDIKPSNVMLLPDGDSYSVKLADFGLIHVQVGSGPTGEVQPGTLDYMAPELLSGKGQPAPASDLFSLGKVLYLALTGQEAEITFGMQTPSQLVPGLPTVVDGAIMACLMDAAHRPTRAGEVADALSQAATEVDRGRVRSEHRDDERKPDDVQQPALDGATSTGDATESIRADAEQRRRDALAIQTQDRSPEPTAGSAPTSSQSLVISGSKSGYGAALLNLFFVGGGGYFYLGQQKKGLFAILITVGLTLIGFGWLPLIAFTIDAGVLGRRLNRGESIRLNECAWDGLARWFALIGVKDT